MQGRAKEAKKAHFNFTMHNVNHSNTKDHTGTKKVQETAGA